MAKTLRRYPFRALVLATVPPCIAAFYVVMYFHWLRSASSANSIETGPPNASLVFYAWFILSVFGLSLGEYGLAGAEAGMLMTQLGRAPHAGYILLHADKTWTGLGGWAKAITAFWTWRSTPSLAWSVLAATTLVSYIAFPLSGLTMELRTGFALGQQHPMVHGANASTFPVLDAYDSFYHAAVTWTTGRLERPPGQSVIYTAEPRDAPIQDLSTEGVPPIFVAPQSSEIVSGRSWGLAAQYNCSVVRKLDDFVLYKRRNETVERGSYSMLGDRFRDWEGATFVFRNWTRFPNDVGVAARLEMATSLDYYGVSINPWEYKQGTVSSANESGPISFNRDYPGLDKPAVIEAVLWQAMEPRRATLTPGVSRDVGATVENLFDASGESNFTQRGFPVPAIGVSCSCASAIGEATIDGLRQTFSDFVADKSTIIVNETTRRSEAPLILSLAAFMILPLELFDDDEFFQKNWVQRLFASVGADGYIVVRNETTDEFVLPRLLTADDLRRSMIQAFGSYTQQLMYRGFQATNVSASRDELAWTHESLAVAEKALILGEGVLPPVVVAALLILWAAICLSLALCYSFRRRWAETMDGFSVICFGADADRYGVYDPMDNPRKMERCSWIKRLPGMVGDARPGQVPGYITLSDVTIEKDKAYV